jgi:hypothetical protein
MFLLNMNSLIYILNYILLVATDDTRRFINQKGGSTFESFQEHTRKWCVFYIKIETIY